MFYSGKICANFMSICKFELKVTNIARTIQTPIGSEIMARFRMAYVAMSESTESYLLVLSTILRPIIKACICKLRS